MRIILAYLYFLPIIIISLFFYLKDNVINNYGFSIQNKLNKLYVVYFLLLIFTIFNNLHLVYLDLIIYSTCLTLLYKITFYNNIKIFIDKKIFFFISLITVLLAFILTLFSQYLSFFFFEKLLMLAYGIGIFYIISSIIYLIKSFILIYKIFYIK